VGSLTSHSPIGFHGLLLLPTIYTRCHHRILHIPVVACSVTGCRVLARTVSAPPSAVLVDWTLQTFSQVNAECTGCCCRFRLTYRLILREKELHFNIGVYNPSKELTFSFNLLLHTYFKVPDVRRCQITGLHGCTFIDKVTLSLLSVGYHTDVLLRPSWIYYLRIIHSHSHSQQFIIYCRLLSEPQRLAVTLKRPCILPCSLRFAR
jgi:hypothetical protein